MHLKACGLGRRVTLGLERHLLLPHQPIESRALAIVRDQHHFDVSPTQAITRGFEREIVDRDSELDSVTGRRPFKLFVVPGRRSIRLGLWFGRRDESFVKDLSEVWQAARHQRLQGIARLFLPLVVLRIVGVVAAAIVRLVLARKA